MKQTSEEQAINQLASALGKDWRARSVDYLAAQMSPINSSDFGEAFDISVVSSAACLRNLLTLDLVSAYHRKGLRNAIEKKSGIPNLYFLMHELHEYDVREFIPLAN